ncbi:hypothetical protein GY45DRAFT_1376185 [Cubamyces sp. BRFM 1775]|nr:hypothetical protein GY45DRAFT_1376185 [Cubamyces sp. BRFM 1775]
MSLGITSVAQQIPRLLEDSRQFTNIEAKRFHAPIGDWQSHPEMKAMGHEFREMMIVYARSMKEVLLGGPYAAHAETLAQGYLHDIRIIPGIVSTCFTVHARKVGPGTTPKARERMEGSSISADISDVTRSDGGFKLSSSSYSPSARVEKG